MSLSIFNYMSMTNLTWRDVNQKNIISCFRKTGFVKDVEIKLNWMRNKKEKTRVEFEN